MTASQIRWRWWQLAVTGVLLYVLFLAITLPAYWLSDLVIRASRGMLRLEATQGSVWDGSGNLVVRHSGPAALTSRIHWNFQPLALFTGRLQVELQARGDLAVKGQVALGYHTLHLGNIEAELPATLIQAFYTPAALLSPTGTLRASAAELELGRSGLAGEGKLTWLGAGGKFGGIGEIGDYQLVVSGQNGPANLRLETLRGDLRLDARGSWQLNTDGLLQLDGTLTAGPREAMLAPLLTMLNARKEGDRHAFQISTRLAPPAFLGGSS
jgi:hypothetical protein